MPSHWQDRLKKEESRLKMLKYEEEEEDRQRDRRRKRRFELWVQACWAHDRDLRWAAYCKSMGGPVPLPTAVFPPGTGPRAPGEPLPTVMDIM